MEVDGRPGDARVLARLLRELNRLGRHAEVMSYAGAPGAPSSAATQLEVQRAMQLQKEPVSDCCDIDCVALLCAGLSHPYPHEHGA